MNSSPSLETYIYILKLISIKYIELVLYVIVIIIIIILISIKLYQISYVCCFISMIKMIISVKFM